MRVKEDKGEKKKIEKGIIAEEVRLNRVRLEFVRWLKRRGKRLATKVSDKKNSHGKMIGKLQFDIYRMVSSIYSWSIPRVEGRLKITLANDSHFLHRKNLQHG